MVIKSDDDSQEEKIMKRLMKFVSTLLVVVTLLTVTPMAINAEEIANTPTTVNNSLEDFVERLYNRVLGRNAEPAGLAYWVNEIRSGRKTVIEVSTQGFFHSTEFLNKNLNDTDYVKTLYRTFLDREAENAGFKYWMNKLRNGTTRDSIIGGFANSNEFANIMKVFGVDGSHTTSTKAATAITTNAATAPAKKTVKEGNAGKVEIYRGTKLVYSMSLQNGKSSQWQKIVDNKTTALLTNFMGKGMLADHASQGLKAMKNCKAGDRLVITKKGKKTTYKMTTKYTNGKNTGAGILIGKKYADEMKDGNLFAYCCNDSKGKSVTVTFWKKQK